MADVDGESVRLSKVLNSMETSNTQFNFIIVDACRNNPVYRKWPSAIRSGFVPKGLTEEKPPRGTIIFYATRELETASDGRGDNSPFTSNLLEHIVRPNLDVALMMREVTDRVVETTNGEQEPWYEGSVRGSGEFYLNPQQGLEPPKTSSNGNTVITPPNFPSQLLSNRISNVIGVNYSKLIQLLAEENWKEADRETTRVMLQAADREAGESLRVEDIEEFSCEHLDIINRLWLESSQGKFGFSVQKEIWQKLGSPTADSPIEDWRKFYIEVGWKTKESGINSSQGYVNYDQLLSFNNYVSSFKGSLPTCGQDAQLCSFNRVKRISSRAQRFLRCGI